MEQLYGASRQSVAAEIPAVHIALQVAAVDHVHLAVCVQVGHAQRHQAIGIIYGAGTRYQLGGPGDRATRAEFIRSEEHTSELQSLMRISYAVFCLNKKIRKPRTRVAPF